MTKLLNYIRFISKIDLNYFRKPQTGHCIFEYNNRKYNLRISSLMGKEMDSLVIRILNNHQKLTLNNLTYDFHVNQFLKLIAKQENGLFIMLYLMKSINIIKRILLHWKILLKLKKIIVFKLN